MTRERNRNIRREKRERERGDYALKLKSHAQEQIFLTINDF